MRAWAVVAALLALAPLACGETRGDLARSGARDPTFSDAGDSGVVFGSGGGSAIGHADAASPTCLRVTLVRERSEAGTSCAFRLPDGATFGVSSYDPLKLVVSYVDTAGPRYELTLGAVMKEADCTAASPTYYFTPKAAPDHLVLCPSPCALNFDAEASTVGGALVAFYGCRVGDPVR